MSEPDSKRGETAPGAPDESSTGFRVIDRRRFAPDGSERPAEEEAPSSAAPAAAAKPSGAAAAAGSTADTGPVEAPGPAAVASEGPHPGDDFVMSDAPEPSGALPEPTLSTLVLSLSTQALMLLGEIPDMSTGKPVRDLPAARSIIDLLAVLQRKTQGNLDAAEAALFDRILYDLRMRFVEISRS